METISFPGGRPRVAIIAEPGELDADRRVWGSHDRSLPPQRRHALDWLTLCRFQRRDVVLADGSPASELLEQAECVIVAREPASMGPDDVAVLEAALTSRPIVLIARAAPSGHPLQWLSGTVAEGVRSIEGAPRWVGPGPAREWSSRLRLSGDALRIGDGCVPWAFAGGTPLRRGARGRPGDDRHPRRSSERDPRLRVLGHGTARVAASHTRCRMPARSTSRGRWCCGWTTRAAPRTCTSTTGLTASSGKRSGARSRQH